jgi:hypothetical protein
MIENMASRLSPHFIELVYDALLKSFWRKKALRSFLRRSHVSENFLGQLSDDETKRDWLDRMFRRLEETEKGQVAIEQMAQSLAEQTSFPDLENWEDSAQKIRAARAAIAALNGYLQAKEREKEEKREAEERRKRAAELRDTRVRSQTDLITLRERLDGLVPSLGTQRGGYDFQVWFYDLMDFSDIDNRRPYVEGGRQIDGSLTIDGTTYLAELKFTATQADATDVDSLFAKVNTKADNTMGIMVSMAGYSSVAVPQASFAKSPILLFDHAHLYLVLGGIETFADVVRRVRRHSSQTGNAYLRVQDFGGRN